jgi:Fe-S cluster assembly ATP-binding protein
MSVFRFKKHVQPILELLNIKKEFLDRNLNEGFSGGEKKKCEILQMAILQPDLVILDETDSGLDVDSLKEVFTGISKLKIQNPKMSILVITHYNRVLEYLEPDKVHIVEDGVIVKEGTAELAHKIDNQGYNESQSQ